MNGLQSGSPSPSGGKWSLPLTMLGTISLAALVCGSLAFALPFSDLEADPINYTKATPTDEIAHLQEKINTGKVRLDRAAIRGYLDSLLKHLDIPVSSQVLVFSRTSLQHTLISPSTPRAIYFNDDTYIGWIPDSPKLEISTADPQLGGVFYTLPQQSASKPMFVRQTHECLSCHLGRMTQDVPGHTIRSVFTTRDGQPYFGAGTYITTHESPMQERWGGWYVTGTHGKQFHLGNQTFGSEAGTANPDRSQGANVTDLRRRFDTSIYLSPHSDIVALMVLEHQTYVHNLITRAALETRRAWHYQLSLADALDFPKDRPVDSTVRRMRSATEPLVRGLLFSGEPALTGPVKGTTTFAADFAKRGPKDPKGRSLRDFDLQRRMFRYPCSYLIYTRSFLALPDLAKDYVYQRLEEVLSGKDTSKEFAHLSPEDRKAIREILTATHADFAGWLKKPRPQAVQQ